MAKQPTISELNAQKAELERQMAQAQLPALQTALDALSGEHAKKLADAMKTAMEGLADGPTKQACHNVDAMLRSARENVRRAHENARSATTDAAPEGEE